MPTRTQIPNAAAVAFMILTLGLSTFFRVWHLGNIPGINGDEAFYGVVTQHLLQGEPVSWITPNGNILNPLYYVPCILLHMIFPPSFVLLRSIAVACGLLALCANYHLCRRVYDQQTAIASTCLLAVLPEDIAQGRFGWDPSQSLMADTFVIYLSLLVVKETERSRKWAIGAVVALAASLVIHPTNVFLAPFVALAFAWRWGERLIAWGGRRRADYAASTCALIVILAAGTWGTTHNGISQLAHIPALYADLFSGATIYCYIPGSLTFSRIAWEWTAIPLVIFAATLCWGLRVNSYRWAGSLPDRLLFAGWVLCTAVFFLVASPYGFFPGNERYALCLIVPGTLAVSRFVLCATAGKRALRAAALALGAIACMAFLASFYVMYFEYIEAAGGNSEMTFRTGPVEPKLAAWRLIRSQSRAGQPLIIFSDEYWNYEPLSYLADSANKVTVLYPKATIQSSPPAFLNAVQNGDVWSVEFNGSTSDRELFGYLAAKHIRFTDQQIKDYSGQPVLDVVHWNP